MYHTGISTCVCIDIVVFVFSKHLIFVIEIKWVEFGWGFAEKKIEGVKHAPDTGARESNRDR